MLKAVFSNGKYMLLVTSILYLLVIMVVMCIVISDYDPQRAEKVESFFWASLILGFGIPVLAIFQFCLNMYMKEPINDIRAATFIVVNAFVDGVVLKYFIGASFGV
jgi:hypothetical protein